MEGEEQKEHSLWNHWRCNTQIFFKR